MSVPTAPVAAGSMLGSYVVASRVGSSGGAVLALAGGLGWCARTWAREEGAAVAVGLSGVYLAGFGLSHPLARKVGAWPSVLGVTALTGLAAHVIADRG